MNSIRVESHSIDPSVMEEISAGNPWYVGNQFEWAQKPFIWRIYEKRYRYFLACISRAKARRGSTLRLLDAGCGDGYWLSRFSAIPGLQLAGIDYNPVRVERARRIVPGSQIHCCDLMDLETDEPYDVILLSQVIEHIEDDVGLLRRIRNNIRKDGTLILGTTNEGSRLHQWQIRRWGKSYKTDHIHFYTESEIRGKLVNVGFRIGSVMREVFAIPSQRLYYGLTRRGWGFTFLELLTRLIPGECSDYYFECLPLKGEG
jgi:SAM-dependent methyltransferase